MCVLDGYIQALFRVDTGVLQKVRYVSFFSRMDTGMLRMGTFLFLMNMAVLQMDMFCLDGRIRVC